MSQKRLLSKNYPTRELENELDAELKNITDDWKIMIKDIDDKRKEFLLSFNAAYEDGDYYPAEIYGEIQSGKKDNLGFYYKFKFINITYPDRKEDLSKNPDIKPLTDYYCISVPEMSSVLQRVPAMFITDESISLDDKTRPIVQRLKKSEAPKNLKESRSTDFPAYKVLMWDVILQKLDNYFSNAGYIVTSHPCKNNNCTRCSIDIGGMSFDLIDDEQSGIITVNAPDGIAGVARNMYELITIIEDALHEEK